jgi:hypothetical protein
MVFDTHVTHTHTLHRASWPCTGQNFDKLKIIIAAASDKNARLARRIEELMEKYVGETAKKKKRSRSPLANTAEVVKMEKNKEKGKKKKKKLSKYDAE